MNNMIFPFMVIATGVASILNFGLGLFILFFSYIHRLLLGSKDRSTLLFALLQFVLGLWGFGMVFVTFALQLENYVYPSIVSLGVVTLLIPLIFLIFVLHYTKNSYRRLRSYWAIGICAIMMVWMSIPRYGLVSFVGLNPVLRIQTPYFVSMGLYVTGMTIVGVYHLLRASVLKKGEISLHYRLVALAVAMSSGIGAWGLVQMYFTQNSVFAFLGPIATLILTGTTTYLITHRGFFHIKKLYSEMLIVIGLMTMVISLELSINAIFQDSFQVAQSSLIAVMFVCMASVMMILTNKSLVGEYSLEKLEKDLEDLIEDKNTFLKISSHQLRTPLTAIAGYLERVVDEQDRYPAGTETMNIVSKMRQITSGLQGTVNDLLSINAINSGQFEVLPNQSHDLKTLIEQIVQNKEFFFNSHHIKTRVYTRGEDFNAEIDYYKVRETFNNLIDNAVYYGKSKVSIAIIEKKEKIEIIISDDGIGFDEESRKKFFKRFSRTEQTEKINPNGSGLGLYLGNLIIEKHHGKITAKSKGPNLGSQFIIELPKTYTSK